MLLDAMPIHEFVVRAYETKVVQRVVEGWRVEPSEVIERATAHFREMGVFSVASATEKLLYEDLLRFLKHSPEMLRLVAKAKASEGKRRRYVV